MTSAPTGHIQDPTVTPTSFVQRPDADGIDVTVIMSARNAAIYLDSAIEQIEAQTLRTYEVIVVDDASEDATPKLLAEWAARDARVQLLTNAIRLGVARSRNRALRQASGSYLWFADCDDSWSPEILARLVDAARRQQADVVVCGARRVRADGHDAGLIAGADGPPVRGPDDAIGRLLRGDIEGHLWNKLFSRSLFNGVEFPPSFAFSDLGAMGTLLASARSVALLNESLYTYVLRPGSILNSKDAGPRDLLVCRERMWSAVEELPDSPGLIDDKLRFEYAAVYLPTLHGLIRRDAHDAEALAVRDEIRASITIAAVVKLARLGRVQHAVAALGLKYAFRPYAWAYQAFRRAKWGPVVYGS